MDAPSSEPIAARRYVDGDEDAVLELLRRAFGSWPLEAGLEGMEHEFLRWKHFEGPWGPSGLYVAEAGGRIVGFRGYMPWRLTTRDRSLMAVQVVDAATDPEFGSRGVFNLISSLVVEELLDREREAQSGLYQLTFATPNALSKRATDRASGVAATYKTVVAGTFGFSVRQRRARMLRRRLGMGGAHRAVSAPSTGEVLEDAEEVNAVLDESRPSRPRIATARTVDYLRWRYPSFLGYHAVPLERNGGLAGLAIFRVRDAGYGYQEARVAELLVSSGDRQGARALLADVARWTSAEWITCCFTGGSDAQAAAESAGFESQPQRMTLFVTQFGAVIEPDPVKFDSWALTLGDVEELL